ncbi:MAG: low molecular weight phosphotyrosine protein phosphatase [Bacteroidetes bacterium]|nr:low molecular weight phosphotyrosine protein phosphatase [Bacteroidota bacterium]
MKILILCHGNICRSPMAEGILKHKLKQQGKNILVESAGFESYHIGDKPDERTIQTLQKHQINILGKRARLFKKNDFDEFDKIYFMDDNNFLYAKKIARNSEDLKKLDYIMNVLEPKNNIQVPDPYYGGKEGFDSVYKMLDMACQKIADSNI